MRIQIETYRGQSIEYDDDRDRFICEMVIENDWKTKTSLKLSEVRKAIDQFIKLNADFKPFIFLDRDFRPVKIVAVRTDGKFVDSEKNMWSMAAINSGYRYGRSGSFSYVPDPEIMDEANALEEEFEALRLQYVDRKKAIQAKYEKFDTSHLQIFQP